MNSRQKIPDSVVTSIVVRSRRRCCLCVYLCHDNDTKRGQLAHVNHDSSDNREENLVFLCLPHHDEYDSETRLSRRLTKAEVKRYRDLLYRYNEDPYSDSEVPENTPIEVLEERISTYYHEEADITSSKLYLTPSLNHSLFLADKNELTAYCRQSRSLHIVHCEKGLGILPQKPIRDFFEMEKHLHRYEREKKLPRDWAGKSQMETVDRWIEMKTDEVFSLVCTYLQSDASDQEKEAYILPEHIGHLSHMGGDLSPFFRVDRIPTWALIRFSFHVGKLYRCALKEIIVVCNNRDEYDWFRLLHNAVSVAGPVCDVLPEYPHYDFLMLPPLKVKMSTPKVSDIIEVCEGVLRNREDDLSMPST